MVDTPPPTVPFGDDDRHYWCQMAVEIPLQELIEDAIRAGWNEVEVITAIIEVADNLMLAAGTNAEIEALLHALKRKLE